MTNKNVKEKDETTKTLGNMLTVEYDYGTEADEMIEILAGDLEVKLQGSENWRSVSGGESFDVPANSRFQLEVTSVVDYCCSYLA